MASQTLSREDVAKHNHIDDLWCIIDHRVYDLTDFVDAHPGGVVVLGEVAGTDCTTIFYNLHRQEVLKKYSNLCIGIISNEKPEVIEQQPGDLSPVPYAEPLWLKPEFKSPYYNESHKRLQRAMRKFVDTHITPEAEEKEKDGTYVSQELIDKMAAANLLAMKMGPGEHLQGRDLLHGAMKGDGFDFFHDLIIAQESSRPNARGFQDGNLAGLTISLTAVQHWLKDIPLRKRVTDECLSGQKKICLAVSEAFAGSDVAGIRTTAEKTTDGKYYIINGTKKWITNGVICDYFVTACKTTKGISVILVPRQEGVETIPIKTSYSPSAGTAFIQYENVKVPVSHLMGEEDKGFAVIMGNFNHERFMMCCIVIRKMRTVTEECLKWCHQRIIFGKRLIDQPAIRQKLGRMISLVEANQAWLEQITYQLNNMSYKEQNKHLGGPIGLLKAFSTRSAAELSDNAVNIFGGRALTQTGMGKVIEMFHRTYKFDAILGGTEEILTDLGVRQAMKHMPKAML